VPLYEFECERCGARFEELVDAGTASVACRSCGAEGTRRLYSPVGPPLKVVKSPGDKRKQERRNAALRAGTKRRFKETRRRARRGGTGAE
jgi:putative FmdB family regulatory protein